MTGIGFSYLARPRSRVKLYTEDGLHLSSSATSATVMMSVSAGAGRGISDPASDTVTTNDAGNETAVVGFMVLLLTPTHGSLRLLPVCQRVKACFDYSVVDGDRNDQTGVLTRGLVPCGSCDC